MISENSQPSYVEAREVGMGKTNKTHLRSFPGRPTWNDNEVLRQLLERVDPDFMFDLSTTTPLHIIVVRM